MYRDIKRQAMSKARRLKKMAKRRRFYERLHEALLEALAWAKGDIELRATVVTSVPRLAPIRRRKAGEHDY